MMKSKIIQLFQKGNYKEAVDYWEAHESSYRSIKKDQNLVPTLVIGSLCYLGRRVEAEEFPRQGVNELGRNFFLGIALTRESNYLEAKKKFDLNMRLLKSHSDDLSLFFAWQGQGFYSFFSGYHTNLLKQAEKSYRAVLRTPFIRGQTMALDLMAHGLFFSGKVQEAFEALDQASERAQKMGAANLKSSYEVTKVCLQAQINSNPQEAMSKLHSVLKDLTAQDTYSRNTIQLEILRQLIHGGQFFAAHQLFSQISPEIYRSKNRRQIAILLHRYAFLLSIQGSYLESLTVLRSARMHLNELVDLQLILRSYALECDILKRHQPFDQKSHEEASVMVEKLQTKTSTFIGRRIQSRVLKHSASPPTSAAMRPKNITFTRGQDPLGDLLDQASTTPAKSLVEMVKQGLWGLIPRFMGWDPLSSRIILDVTELYALIQIRDRCQLSNRPIKGLSRKLIELMGEGRFFSKQELVSKIWGYSYESLRHDSLLHSGLHQLREHLGVGTEVIQSSEEGFKLMIPIFSSVAHKLIASISSPTNTSPFNETNKTVTSQTSQTEDKVSATTKVHGGMNSNVHQPLFTLPTEYIPLNARQISLLRSLELGASIDIRRYCRQFDVSHMTAFRDLLQLKERQFLERVGKGRSTSYIRIR